VSGPAGSGKTTYAKDLAQHFGLQYLSAGAMFRRFAKEKGVTLSSLSDLSELDATIDHRIDGHIKEQAKKGNMVADGRLTGFMLREIADVKIYVTAPIPVRVVRVMQRDEVSEKYARNETLHRDESEKKRYMEIYQINITDLSIYDLIVNTEKWSKEAVIQLLRSAVDNLIYG
jgi:cytidylate kinase